MNILAYLAAPVHLDGLALELGKLQFDGTARVGGGDFKLEPELVADKVVHAGAGAGPGSAFFVVGLDLEPVVVSVLVELDVTDDCLELLLEALLPLFVLGPGVDGQQGDVVGCLLYGTLHRS